MTTSKLNLTAPPLAEQSTAAFTGSSILNAVALNPQPLPPRQLPLSQSVSSSFDKVAINPQPLPPKGLLSQSVSSSFDKVAINPQPLPPKQLFGQSAENFLNLGQSLTTHGIIIVGGKSLIR